MAIAYEDYLQHYGVKGMKWGVRKDANSLSNRQLRKSAQSNIQELSPEINRRQLERRYNTSIESYGSLDSKDLVVKKGTVLKRTTVSPDKDRSVDNLFVSTNENDARNYRSILPMGETGKPQRSYKDHYETALKATEDLKSPSEKARVDGYVKLMGTPEIRLNSGESINGREYLRRSGLGETVDQLSNKQLALTYYGQLAAVQGIRDDPINTAYFNSLKKSGYNALVDDNDRGVLSNEPLLVFDAYKNLETVSVKRLDTRSVQEAQASMRLP